MEKNEIERYDFFVSVYKTETGEFDYLIGQEFEGEDGVEEMEFVERGTSDSLEGAATLASEGIKSLFR